MSDCLRAVLHDRVPQAAARHGSDRVSEMVFRVETRLNSGSMSNTGF